MHDYSHAKDMVVINYNASKNWPTILLSIILHILLLIIIFFPFFLSSTIKKQKQPFLYAPSYLYSSRSTTSPALSIHHTNPSTSTTISTKQLKKTIITNKKPIKQKSMLIATDQFLKGYQQQFFNSVVKYEEPIYLIGDHQQSPHPLIKLLAYALSAHFNYPESAGRFGITGKAIIGMTLHPDGHLSDIQLLKSTDNVNLDNAALYAVNQAPIIKKAGRYLSYPKHFVIGFIFRVDAHR